MVLTMGGVYTPRLRESQKKKKEEREKRLHQQGSRVGGVRGRGGPPLSCF